MMIEIEMNPQNQQNFQNKIMGLIIQRNIQSLILNLMDYLEKNENYNAAVFYGLGNIQDQKGYYLHRQLQWYQQQLQQKSIILNYWDLLSLCCSTIYQNYQFIVNWYKKMMENHAEKEEIHLGLANLYYNNNKYQESQIYFTNVLKINPKSEKGYQLISFLYYFKYEHDEQALKYIQKCLQLNPQNIYAKYLIAVTQQQSVKQIQHLEELIRQYPFYTRSYIGFYFHFMYRHKGDQEQNLKMAQFYCHKALELNPLYDNTYESLANIYKKKKQFEKATQYCLKALKLRPNQDNPYNVLGNIELDQDNYQQAIQYYTKCTDINPMNFHAMFNLGLAFQNCGQYQKAVLSYKKCLQYKPTNYDASYNLALLSCQLKDKESQIKYYELCISINPKQPNAYYNLGVRYIQQEQYQKAITYFENSILANSQMHKAYYNIGDCLINLNRYSEAIGFIKQSLQIQNNNTLYSISLARAFLRLKKYDEIMELVEITKKNFQNYQGLSSRNKSFVESQLTNFYGSNSQWIKKARLGIFPLMQMLKLKKLENQFLIKFQQILK